MNTKCSGLCFVSTGAHCPFTVAQASDDALAVEHGWFRRRTGDGVQPGDGFRTAIALTRSGRKSSIDCGGGDRT
jgi:hypothetical protein